MENPKPFNQFVMVRKSLFDQRVLPERIGPSKKRCVSFLRNDHRNGFMESRIYTRVRGDHNTEKVDVVVFVEERRFSLDRKTLWIPSSNLVSRPVNSSIDFSLSCPLDPMIVYRSGITYDNLNIIMLIGEKQWLNCTNLFYILIFLLFFAYL